MNNDFDVDGMLNHHDTFALGVAYEMIGEFEKAKEQYLKAAEIGEDEQYQSSLTRIKVKLGGEEL